MINLCSETADCVRRAEWSDWHWQVRHAVTDIEALTARLPGFPESAIAALAETARHYPFRVTPYYLGLAREASPDDPILRQCLPGRYELQPFEGESDDPFSEEENSPVPGLVRRYTDRALLLVDAPCPVLCRHCFRKRHWRTDSDCQSGFDIDAVTGYLSEHPEIRELILSGGEPFMLENHALLEILGRVRSVNTLETIRAATRVPATLPRRLTRGLCRDLAEFGPLWVVAHFNHPRELTPESAEACANLADNGLPVVSQTVLLRGVNDDAAVLRTLFTGLLAMRVKPYYLFHGDPVKGTMHFRVPVETGRELIEEVRATTSGLAIPAYAADLPGAPAKTRLG